MKITPRFDPDAVDYGPCSATIRQVLHAFAAIDWFAPATCSDAEAAALFREHQVRAHAASPELFSEAIEITVQSGDWTDFAALRTRVTASGAYDWKYGALKPMAKAHQRRCDWSPALEAQRWPLESVAPGQLYFCMPDGTPIWALDVGAFPRDATTADGWFYFDWARIDVLDVIEWQLAAGGHALATDPFWALLGCYAARIYPFMLARDRVSLFRFAA